MKKNDTNTARATKNETKQNQIPHKQIPQQIPRIKHGKKQTLDTLINEEALLLAKYIRDEKKDWIPRIAMIR